DVRDAHSMRHLIQGIDVLFNLAGQTSHLDSMTDPFTDLEINCRAQLSILEACRSANPGVKIVFASTRQIYGKPDHLPTDERHRQVFEPAGARVLTLPELAEMVVTANGGGTFEVHDFPPERKRIDIGDYYADFGLIHQTLGWDPRISLSEGLARTLDFYR